MCACTAGMFCISDIYVRMLLTLCGVCTDAPQSTFVGCFRNAEVRVLKTLLARKHTDMHTPLAVQTDITLGKCYKLAKENGFAYYGVENGDEVNPMSIC